MPATAEAAPSTGKTLHRPVLHHINLKTTRLGEMIDWYGKVVGAELTFRNEMVAFISNDACNHRIALISTPLLRDDAERFFHTGMHHVAFEYASVDQLLETWERLDGDMGLAPHMALNHGMTLSFYYVDPDGNSVELQADWFGDWSASKRYMSQSGDFAADPIGKFVDPARMLAARRAGASIDDLNRRSFAGEFPAVTPPDLRLAIPAP